MFCHYTKQDGNVNNNSSFIYGSVPNSMPVMVAIMTTREQYTTVFFVPMMLCSTGKLLVRI